MTTQDKLEPCPTPWCDHSDAPYVWQGVGDLYTVICGTCQVEGPEGITEAQAIDLWQTRTPAASNAGEGDGRIPVGFYQWLYGIERDVRVWDLTPNEIANLIAALTPPEEARTDDGLVELVRRCSPGFMGAVVSAMGARVRDAQGCGRFPEEIREVEQSRRADFVLAQELADAMPRIRAALSPDAPDISKEQG